jgi:predicted transcriptional regulator
MPRLELKSSQTFLAIKRYEGTKIEKVIEQSQSSIYKLAPLGVFLLNVSRPCSVMARYCAIHIEASTKTKMVTMRYYNMCMVL